MSGFKIEKGESMKLVLANNQTDKFRNFHNDIQKDNPIYDYSGYNDLLFLFDNSEKYPSSFINLATGVSSYEYEGVYINGYINTPDVALAVATVLKSNDVPFVNEEIENGVSLSKLSASAKLAAAGVTMPKTYGGFKQTIINGLDNIIKLSFPAVLKRVDADRGIDNYKVKSAADVKDILSKMDDDTIWLLQEFIPNDGFYLVSFYYDEPKYSIFRTLEKRPDGNEHLAHMYKPKGGINATMIDVKDLPKSILETSKLAVKTMNRQFASVDSIYDEKSDKTYIMEVNYNPQMVTIETFKDVRIEAFLEAMEKIGQ